MPAKSQAQRAYLNMKFGHAWVKRHHFDNKGHLPEHVTSGSYQRSKHKKKTKPRKSRSYG